MIRTYLAAAAIAATPGLAVAELSFKGSAIVGAGNHGLASGVCGRPLGCKRNLWARSGM